MIADKRGREREYVVILKPWEDEPTYHAYDDATRIAKIDNKNQLIDETVCGRDLRGPSLFVPLKHAKKFGRPCQQCWAKENK